jgi:hypothetical protein
MADKRDGNGSNLTQEDRSKGGKNSGGGKGGASKSDGKSSGGRGKSK